MFVETEEKDVQPKCPTENIPAGQQRDLTVAVLLVYLHYDNLKIKIKKIDVSL